MPTAPAERASTAGPPAPASLAEQALLVRALGEALGRARGVPVRHIETHISHVLLCGGHAYKIKKAMSTSFLDQRTLAQRRHACAEELRLNRRLAPDLYLDVVEIRGTPRAPRLAGPNDLPAAIAAGMSAAGGRGRANDGEDPVLDVAVHMRMFDEEGLWDRLAARGELGPADVDDLAARLARFHAAAAGAPDDPASPLGQPRLARQALLDSLADLQGRAAAAGWPHAAGLAALERLRAWEATAWVRAAPAMASRLAAGRVREGHGDLHLGNVAREAGHCLVFDGIEFSDAFRWLDVMDEVAFMTMDLHAHGLPALAHRFANAYLEASGDYEGLRVFDYYLVHRALVRAKVAQLRLEQARRGEDEAAREAALDAAARYLGLAGRLARPRPRAFAITHGLSGSGKTTLTQGLVEQLGAVRVRADVERKRLAGLAPLQGSRSAPGAGLYTTAMNEATQARLLAAAASVVEAGWPVVVDATFIRRGARDEARRCAARLAVPFFILRFDAPAEALRERVQARRLRGDDASEADLDVLAAQQQALEPLAPDELADTFEVRPETGGPGPARDSGPAADWAPLLARLGAVAPPSCGPSPPGAAAA